MELKEKKIERVIEWKRGKDSDHVYKTPVVFNLEKLSEEDILEYAMRGLVITMQGRLRSWKKTGKLSFVATMNEPGKEFDGVNAFTYTVPKPNEARGGGRAKKSPEELMAEYLKEAIAKGKSVEDAVQELLAGALAKAGLKDESEGLENSNETDGVGDDDLENESENEV